MIKEIKIINKIQKDIKNIQAKKLHNKTLRNSFIPHSVAIGRSKLKKYNVRLNKVNCLVGGSCIGVGIGTCWVPFTTIPLVSFGLLCIASPVDLPYLIRELKKDIKFKLGLFLR